MLLFMDLKNLIPKYNSQKNLHKSALEYHKTS